METMEAGAGSMAGGGGAGEGPEPPRGVPEGWSREFSRSQQREYWFHKESGKSVWRMEDLPAVSAGGGAGLKRPAPPPPTSDGAGAGTASAGEAPDSKRRKEAEGRKVAVIVPFRDLHAAQRRREHLDQFVPHMERFLADIPGVAAFHVFIVVQSRDGRKFNRGKLLNIGFKLACEHESVSFDSFIFHDVDLLPQRPLAEWYAREPKDPIHIARCWGRYNDSDKYFGGIVAFSRADYELIDGFPTTFWGWGGEDDELQVRVETARLRIVSPPKNLPGAVVDLEGMDLKTKLGVLRKTDWKCKVKWEVRDEYKDQRAHSASKPWWGLAGTEFAVEERSKLAAHTSMITVDVLVNKEADGRTHWANQAKYQRR